MRLTDLLRTGRLRRHSTSAQEIAQLLELAQQRLADARVEAISSDLRFCAAYEAALQLATIPICCAGYRAAGLGHHATVFEALPLGMGPEFAALSAYYNACRIKRNVAQYRRAGEIMDSEVDELIDSVDAFMRQVREWLQANHPEFVGD